MTDAITMRELLTTDYLLNVCVYSIFSLLGSVVFELVRCISSKDKGESKVFSIGKVLAGAIVMPLLALAAEWKWQIDAREFPLICFFGGGFGFELIAQCLTMKSTIANIKILLQAYKEIKKGGEWK